MDGIRSPTYVYILGIGNRGIHSRRSCHALKSACLLWCKEDPDSQTCCQNTTQQSFKPNLFHYVDIHEIWNATTKSSSRMKWIIPQGYYNNRKHEQANFSRKHQTQ